MRAIKLLSVFVLLLIQAKLALGAFAIFMVSSSGQVAVSCNALTGVATGVGAGTCMSTPATCTNSGDDTAAFATFNDWVVNTWQATHTGIIQLFVPSGSVCRFASTTNFAVGIKKILVSGSGATFNDAGGTGFIRMGGLGQYQDNAHSARTATVSAGASSVTLVTAGQTSLFMVGQYALMTGLDLQGLFSTSYGFPTNQQFFEYVLVTAKDGGCTGTGTVCFSSPLTKSYKSTWPLYNAGTAGEVDAGGPATLYALDPSWDIEAEYSGLTISIGGVQTGQSGRSIKFTNVTLTGSACIFPSQNGLWQLTNVAGSGCSMEVDKLIDRLVVQNTTYGVIQFQSSSINTFTLSANSTVTLLNGSARSSTISNSALTTFKPGAYSFGRTDETVCTSCAIASFNPTGGSGYIETGWNDVGIDNVYTMSGGVISSPNGTTVSAAADNGSGKVRLTVASSAGFTTGKYVQLSGTNSNLPPPSSFTNTGVQITVIDGTHLDLPGVTFSGSNYATGFVSAVIQGGSLHWAVPGANIWFLSNSGAIRIFQVVDVTQNANNTLVQTTEAAGFPTGSPLRLWVHPSPKFTCTSCTGDPQVVGFGNAVAAAPLYSYQQYTYTGSIGLTPQPFFTQLGNVTQINIDVTSAYGGAGGLNYNMSTNQPVSKSDFSIVNYSATVNAKSVGNRQVALSGVSCPSGTCTGDGTLTLPDATRSYFAGAAGAGPAYTGTDVSGSCPGAGCPSVTVTVQTDQGVVVPFAMDDANWSWLIGDNDNALWRQTM